MTVEVFTPAPTYTIAGVGPYAIGHPYVEGSLRALVTVNGVEVALSTGDITVTPVSAAVSGNLFLSAGAAATHAGRVLRIERVTVAEQGWVGVQGEREKGLETQLDRTTYTLQELVAIIGRSLRTRDPIAAFVPQAGRTLVFDGTAIIAGPLATEIETAAATVGLWRGTWTTGTAYAVGDRAYEATSGSSYVCLTPHVAGTFLTDLAAARWTLFAKGGDLLASQLLNDLPDKPQARANLGVTLPNLGVTASAAELNILDGVTATSDELNRAANFGLIAQGTLSGSQLIIEIPADFEAVEVTVWNYQPTISGTTLELAVGSGTLGSPVWGTAHYQQGMVLADVSPGYYNVSAAASMPISLLQRNTSGGSSCHTLNGFHVSGPVRGHGFRYGIDSVAVTRTVYESCGETGAVVHSLIRLFVAAGSMAGTYRITGHRKP